MKTITDFESSLPAHKGGLFLTHNEHLGYYQSAESYILEKEELECPPDWKTPESRQRAIDSGEIWEMQWYPLTPIGSHSILAPTLEELLSFAREIEESK